ncbi:ABC transporter substrate-binding protein [Thalassospira alkalitolerans]|uniref:ABC transporter substrate-binding protein n=1 Tax=Thalassospira alkalitolerans TaxID=1293890 RepID=UPI003AA9BB3B
MRNFQKVATATVLAGIATTTHAEDLSLQLNWKAGGDHAPIYYALEQGWYEDAGVDLEVRQGSGSGAAAKALEVGQAELAIIDTPTALQFLANGTPMKGIFVAYNDNAAGIYWKKSSGIENIKDLAGRKIGAPALDAVRQAWVPIANAVGIDPESVTWVNLQPTAKVAALQSDAVDATTHFYSVHFIYEDIFGDDLGYALLRDNGMNNYSLAYFASDDALEEKSDSIDAMVKVTQKAFAFCLETPEPCVQALSSAVSLKLSDASRQFEYAAKIMPGVTNSLSIGEWNFDRLAVDFDVVKAAFDLGVLDTSTVFTNEFIDTSIQYPAAN